ncbi:MAG: hypothetical protein AAGG47_20190 [Pseudomonadota bacterium]
MARKDAKDRANIEEVDKILREKLTVIKKKRVYRRSSERPRPDLPPDADPNKIDAHYQARISRDLSDRVEAFRQASGMTKKQLTETALELLLASAPEPPERK